MRARFALLSRMLGLSLILGPLLAVPALAQQAQCQTNVMGRTFCAREARGVAVKDSLGEVVCARGRCAWDPSDATWHCSRMAGGWARMGAEEAECEEGCYSPSATECVEQE